MNFRVSVSGLAAVLIAANAQGAESTAQQARLAPTLSSKQLVRAKRDAVADVERMRNANVHAFLVGEAFMRATDHGAALAELFR